MERINKLQLYFIQILNYTYFEITPFNRLWYLIYHIYNSLSKNFKVVEVSEIILNKAFVISLKFRNDRRDEVMNQLNLVKLRYEIFDAYFLDDKVDFDNYFSSSSLRYLSHGSLSCAFSHMKLLEHISKYRMDEYFIVFEDDISICDGFDERLDFILNNYPKNADILFLGTRNERKRDIKYRCSNGYNRTYNARLGAYAYVVSGASAGKILKLIKPLYLLCGGIDTCYGKLIRQNRIIAYQLDKNIVTHNPNSQSNIFNPSALRKELHSNTITNWPQRVIK